MSWYSTNNFGNSFGSRSSSNGAGHQNTTKRLCGDNTVFDPFPPSQRQYAWSSAADDIRPEPEPEPEPGTECGEDGSERSLLRERELQHPRSHIHWITESDNRNRLPIPQHLPAVVPGKRKATRDLQIASSSTSKASNDDALRQKRRKLLEIDDWTGVKFLTALKPLEIQFPQYNKEAPVWGWSEAEAGPAYHPSHPHASQRPPALDTFSVKRYSPQEAPDERYSGQSFHSRTGIHGHEPYTPSRQPSEQQSATYLDKGKGRCPPVSPVAVSMESIVASTRSRPSSSVRSGHSPFALAPASSSTFGYERPSPINHFPTDYGLPRSSSRPSNSLHHSVSQRPGSQTSPYVIEEQPSKARNSNGNTTPSFTPDGRQSVVSGTLSEAEQQRFESDGLAILSPPVPTISAPAPSSPRITAPSTPARQSTQCSLQQTPEIQQEPESHQRSPDASEEATEEEAHDQVPDQEDLEREPTREDFLVQPNEAQPTACNGGISRGVPHKESAPVEPKEDVTSRVDDQLETRVHEAGLFEANRVNIRAIPDWDDGEDAIEDSGESEREAVQRIPKKANARRHYFQRKARRLRR